MGGCNSGGGRGAMRQGQFWALDIAVLKRLDRLGVLHIEAPAGEITPKLLNQYLEVKRREMV